MFSSGNEARSDLTIKICVVVFHRRAFPPHPPTPTPRARGTGGKVSMGQGGVGFNSDRVDVWDGATWSFATWGEHTLSEPRHHMGSAVIEIYTGSVRLSYTSYLYIFLFRVHTSIFFFL